MPKLYFLIPIGFVFVLLIFKENYEAFTRPLLSKYLSYHYKLRSTINPLTTLKYWKMKTKYKTVNIENPICFLILKSSKKFNKHITQ